MPRWETKSIKDRFEEKFIPVPWSGCWIWIASSHPRGYGNFYMPSSKRKMDYAHRVSLELYKGIEVKDDESVCHKCDEPSCVNPDHLFVASHIDNMKDMANKNRAGSGRVKLTEEIVLEIWAADDSITTKELAEKFGVNRGHCSRIRNRKIKYWNVLLGVV